MQNNRLVIEYDVNKCEKPMTESLRCTSMEGAKRIMSKRRSYFMKSAIFTDKYRNQSDMKKVRR